MNEYYTPAFVLGQAPKNDKDVQITLYTKELGKIYASAKSMRKITSKLAGHFRVGAFVDVRLLSRGEYYQVIDGLCRLRVSTNHETLRLISFLDAMIPHRQPDIRLWHTVKEVLETENITPNIYKYLLQLMGFADHREGATYCRGCQKEGNDVYFYAPEIIFLCEACLARIKININDAVPVFRQ